jgi:hypothetical protein
MIDNHSFWYWSIMFFIYHTMSLFHLSINSTTRVISISGLFLSRMNTDVIKYWKVFFIYKHKFTTLNINLVMISLVYSTILNNTLFDICLFCELYGFLFCWKFRLYIDFFILMFNSDDEIFRTSFWCSFLYCTVILYKIIWINYCLFYHWIHTL